MAILEASAFVACRIVEQLNGGFCFHRFAGSGATEEGKAIRWMIRIGIVVLKSATEFAHGAQSIAF